MLLNLNVVFRFAMFFILVKRARTNFVILCPQCFSENVTKVVLETLPPKTSYRCDNCGYVGKLEN